MRRTSLGLTLMGVIVTLGCESSVAPAVASLARGGDVAFSQLPGDGNGNKQIVEVFIQNPVNCAGTIITRTVEGWIQMIGLDEGGSASIEVTVYRINYTFTNAAGETFVVRETGIDRVYMEDGFLIVHIAGKTPVHSGIIRFNLDTGERTFEAGQFYDLPRDRACAALT